MKSYTDKTFQAIISGRSLSIREAFLSMEEIMSNRVSPVKLAAWLTALHLKGETSDEITGCAQAMRKYMIKIKNPFENTIDVVGTGGDGKNTINISTAAALVAAGAGIPVAKHGNRSASSKSGSADVLDKLGININIPAKQMEHSLEKHGIAFLFAPSLHPAMKYAAPVRKELAIRTIFNILGPLCNPAGVKRLLLGVFSNDLCATMAESLRNLGVVHAIVVCGAEYVDEVAISGKSLIYEVKSEKIKKYYFSPEDLGVPLASLDKIRGGTPERNAEIIHSVLSGKINGPKKDVILLNAAFAIYIAGKAPDIVNAFRIAEQSLNTGAALNKLEQLKNMAKKQF